MATETTDITDDDTDTDDTPTVTAAEVAAAAAAVADDDPAGTRAALHAELRALAEQARDEVAAYATACDDYAREADEDGDVRDNTYHRRDDAGVALADLLLPLWEAVTGEDSATLSARPYAREEGE